MSIFFINLENEVSENVELRCEFYRQFGYEGAFLSLISSTENFNILLQRLYATEKICQKLDLSLTVELTEDELTLIHIDNLQKKGVTRLVLHEFSMERVAALSQAVSVAVSAENFSKDDYAFLTKMHANFKNVEAWYNRYPEAHKGLTEGFVRQHNIWLHSKGLKVTGFIPGDYAFPYSFFEPYTTIESNRYDLPLVSVIKLANLYTDNICVANNLLSEESMGQLKIYSLHHILALEAKINGDLPDILTNESFLFYNSNIANGNEINLTEQNADKYEFNQPSKTSDVKIGSVILTDSKQADLGKLSIVTKSPEKVSGARVVGQLPVDEWPLLDCCENQQQIILNFVK